MLTGTVRSTRYRSFFFTYLAFLGITVVIGLIAYGVSYVTVRDVTLTASRQDLEYAVDNVRTQITASFDSIAPLVSNPALLTLSRASRPLALRHYLPLVRLREALASAIAGAFTNDIGIVLFRPQLYVSSQHIATDLEWHYEHFMNPGDFLFDDWLALMRGDPYHMRAVLGGYGLGPSGTGSHGAMLLQSIPIGSTRPFGTVVLHVPEDRFLAPISGRLVHDDAFATLTNRDREVVALAGNRQAATRFLAQESIGRDHGTGNGNSSTVVMRSRDDLLGLEFVIGLPRRQLYAPVRLIGLVFLAILIIELISGIALASYLAKRNVRPLRSILSLVSAPVPSAEDGRTDEYEQIRGTLALLANDNRQLSRVVDAQAPLLASSFIEHLLSGKIADAPTLESAAQVAGVTFTHSLFVVCLLSVQTDASSAREIDHPAGKSAVVTILAEQWRSMLPHDVYSYRVEHGTTAFIHNVPTATADRFMERLRSATDYLTRTLTDQPRVRVAVACSRITSNPLDIASRYAEAKALHDYQMTFGLAGIQFASDEAPASRHVVFELDQETALIRHVLAGNADAAEALLDSLMREVIETPHPSELYATVLLRQMEGTLLRLVESITFRDSPAAAEVRAAIEQSAPAEPFARRHAELREHFLRLSQAVRSRRSEQDALLFREMVAFIDRNRCDAQLNLDRLADEFRLSPGHVSRYFKQHAGIGFAEYLEHVRIEEATDLLGNTDLQVTEIARVVGYTNNNTFYKAFRRCKGESAGAYRRRIVIEQSHRQTADVVPQQGTSAPGGR